MRRAVTIALPVAPVTASIARRFTHERTAARRSVTVTLRCSAMSKGRGTAVGPPAFPAGAHGFSNSETIAYPRLTGGEHYWTG